jgi:hypothetical protein
VAPARVPVLVLTLVRCLIPGVASVT